jgi:hypothetical protein
VKAYKEILDRIVRDPRYLRNLDWGDPRPGHPEGTIRAHIAELETNLDALRGKLSDIEYWKLKILIHTHDTFKPDAVPRAPIGSPKSHASLARLFLGEFTNHADLHDVVRNHDVPYALWLGSRRNDKFNQKRFELLLIGISNWDLFLAFLIVDGCTAGKSREPLQWLLGQIAGRVESRFSASDIL